MELEVTGTDLASLANAINYQNGKDSSKPKADYINFTVNNKDYSLTADKISGNSGKITVNVPANTVAGGAGLTAATYPVTVKINGEEQILTTAAKVVVPAELEQDTTIVGCSFGDQLSYTAADKAEVGYDEMAVDHAAGTISIKVPWGTDMSKLVPKVVLKNSKATFSPKNIALTADPTNEKVGTQNITVTAVDGTTKIYKLTATWAATALEKNAEIKSVSFGDQLDYDQDNNVMNFDKAVIDHTAGTVKVIVPWPTKLADLTPAVELNHSGADYSPKNTKLPVPTGTEPVSVDQNIAVTAVDGTTKTYVLTVERVADEAEKDAKIKSFELEFMLNLEIGTTPDANGCLPIDVMVDRSADMTKLNPTIKLGHKNASYVPVGEQNFAEAADNTIIYTVTAVDGTKQKYAVKITQKKNSGGGSTYSVSTAKQEVTAFVTGKEDGNFHPDDMMSRSEAATMLARVHSKFDKNAKYKTDYADVDSSSWYANYVGFLQKQGVVQGNEMGEFMPEKQITRMEFATMMARLAGLPIDKDAVAAFKDIKGTWGEKEITALVEQEIVNGYEDNTFRPNNNISRAEAVAMVNRLMKRGISDEELAALKTVENPFGDIDESHWAYNDIICAVTDYTVTTKTETLGKISDESVTVKINK